VLLRETSVQSILTRTGGYLKTVTSHSMQPYRGCAYGNALCGAYCYVRHNPWLTRGRPWGSFLEVRANAAEVYGRQAAREREWGRSRRGSFRVFLSSSTDPFVPQELLFGVTRRLLEAMAADPPDGVILQTHSHLVTSCLDAVRRLAERTELRVHVSIESDRDRLPGLPPPASSVAARFEAAALLKQEGFRVAICVSPLLPIEDPESFFERIGRASHAVVLDHFIGGDGSRDGARTRATRLPLAMAEVDPGSLTLEYRDRMIGIARRYLPGAVGVGPDGFAGRYLPR
jgi:DNA repair photolyase